MHYYKAKIETDMRDLAYRNYIADSLHFSPQGKYLSTRLRDILDPKPVENINAEDIVSHVIKAGGLSLVEDTGD